MGKQKPGTWVERELFESKAYLSLTGFAPQLLIIILGKRRFEKNNNKNSKRICINKDKIYIPYVEFEKDYGITQPRLTRAIDQLLAKGFIRVINPGGGYKQDKARYGLSDKWTFWNEGCVFEEREKKDRGFCHHKN